MLKKIVLRTLAVLFILTASLAPTGRVSASPAMQSSTVTAYDRIIGMNTLRVSYGNSALVEDPIIDAVAQSTAQVMAANEMSWHIGDVSGRLSSAGYGGGAAVQGTENFAVGSSMSIDQIMLVWSDASHMLPATNSAYCNIGAGMAVSPSGMTYYVLQAGYVSGKSCGSYTSTSGGTTTGTTGSTTTGGAGGVFQLVVPVKIATPDAEGKIYHIVEAGQSFWSIAVAYKITIKDIETWNNISQSSGLQIGQKLFIPGSNTAGYSTPTPFGMFQMSTPDPEGRIIHSVAAYQTLTSISAAYGVDITKILTLNNWQQDWPLQIGQKLVISAGTVTPSPTPRPLTAIERLTPASDGKYYHTVESGQTLSWIASLYETSLGELMAWNGLNESSILFPGQKLLLQITPPATPTHTPGPPTASPTATPVPPTATASPQPTLILATPTPTPKPFPLSDSSPVLWLGLVMVFGTAGFFAVRFYLQHKPI